MTRAEARTSRSLGQAGLSLVELMIAITLGLIIIFAVLYVFAGNRASYLHQQSLSHVQESGRFALELLNRDIRMAGFIGCGSLRTVTPTTNLTASPPDFSEQTAIAGTATQLTLRFGGPEVTRLVQAMPALTQMRTEDDLGFVSGNRLIITDCADAEIFELSADAAAATPPPPGWNLSATANLDRLYPNQSQVLPYQEVIYAFDASTNTITRNGAVVIEGVTAFSFDYGTGPDRRVTAYTNTTTANPEQVLAVRVNMTIASPTDAAINHDFSTTIGLRNRLP